jgi:transcriptional regulator with XRE-family HTH domain
MLDPRDWRRLREQTRRTNNGRPMSLRDVADKMGLSFQRINQFELGDGSPDAMQAISMLRLYAANGSPEARELLAAGLPNEKGHSRPSVILTPRVADLIKAVGLFLFSLDSSGASLPTQAIKGRLAVANALRACMDNMSDEDKRSLEGWI